MLAKTIIFPLEMLVSRSFRSVSERMGQPWVSAAWGSLGFAGHWEARISPSCMQLHVDRTAPGCGCIPLSLCPRALKGSLALGKSPFCSRNLGFHACVGKPGRFIWLQTQWGSDPRMDIWLWRLPPLGDLFWCRPTPTPPKEAFLPLPFGASWVPWGCHFAGRARNPRFGARPPWRASGNGTIRPLNDSNF